MNTTYSLDTIDKIAAKIIRNSSSKIIVFHADLGVGKTTLVRAICLQLGVTDSVSSPSFAIVNEYEFGKEIIYHIDAYRLKNLEEAYQMGLEEYLASESWVFIEWPDQIRSLLYEPIQEVEIRYVENGIRQLKMNGELQK